MSVRFSTIFTVSLCQWDNYNIHCLHIIYLHLLMYMYMYVRLSLCLCTSMTDWLTLLWWSASRLPPGRRSWRGGRFRREMTFAAWSCHTVDREEGGGGVSHVTTHTLCEQLADSYILQFTASSSWSFGLVYICRHVAKSYSIIGSIIGLWIFRS